MEARPATLEIWLSEVKAALDSINMPMETWQAVTPFDFSGEFKSGAAANVAAMKANRFWWRKQNQAINQDCRLTIGCYLPRGHQGECESV